MAPIQLLNCPCGSPPNYLAVLVMALNCFLHQATVLIGLGQQLLTKCVISSQANLVSFALGGLFTGFGYLVLVSQRFLHVNVRFFVTNLFHLCVCVCMCVVNTPACSLWLPYLH